MTPDEHDEPEIQHLEGCNWPIGPCNCPRRHLIAEGRRLAAKIEDQRIQIEELERGMERRRHEQAHRE